MELEQFIDIANFTRVRARRDIRRLEEVDEVLNRKVDHEGASFTSKGSKMDADDDKDLEKSRNELACIASG